MNVHVKLLPVNTKLLSVDTVVISKYKRYSANKSLVQLIRAH